MEKFWSPDLSDIDLIIQDRYSNFVPAPRLPSDMFRSILLSVECRISSYTSWADPIHPPNEKPYKPDKKREKAPPVEKVTVKNLFTQFEAEPPHDMDPCMRLYEIFRGLFLDHSVQEGFIDLMNFSIAGDGTPVYTAAQERKKRSCDCLEKGIRNCKCGRIYSQPDCNI